MHEVQMHAGAIGYLIYVLCICMGDNSLVIARRLSSATYTQTKQ